MGVSDGDTITVMYEGKDEKGFTALTPPEKVRLLVKRQNNLPPK